jgi:hypothetical protein
MMFLLWEFQRNPARITSHWLRGTTVAQALVPNATYFWDTGHQAWIVGQDGILRAGCQPAPGDWPLEGADRSR